ncbi:MAG: DedA family protein [Gaiellales bacterium]
MELFTNTFDFLLVHGLVALAVAVAIENLNVPMPPLLIWGGVYARTGEASLPSVWVACLAGTMVGATICWGIGARGGRPLLERWGRLVGASPARLAAADRWMLRHGRKAVLYGRCVPLVRTGVSLVAGLSRMPLVPYAVLTALGASAWILFGTIIGYAAGGSFKQALSLLPVHPAIAAFLLLLGATGLIVAISSRSRRRFRSLEPRP